jgi:hypothetical protein
VIFDQSIRLFCVACIRVAADCRCGEVRIQRGGSPDAALGRRADTWIVSVSPTPEQQLRKALLASLASIEYALRLDSAAEVLEKSEVRQIDDFERKQTAHVLGELRKLERRWPAIGAL